MTVITAIVEFIKTKNRRLQNVILKQEDEDDETNFYVFGPFVHY